MLVGCGDNRAPASTNAAEKPVVVRFGTLSGPASYQVRGQGPVGIDYELATQFGQFINTPIKITPFSSLETLFQAYQSGDIDIMAAGLTRTSLRQQQWIFSPPLYQVTPVLVYRQGQRPPKSLSKIRGELLVVKDSSHAEKLRQLSRQNPEIHWRQSAEYDSQELMGLVADGSLDYTIADSTALALAQRYYPSLRQGLSIGPAQPVGWALDQARNGWLLSAMLDFWDSELKSGRLQRLEDKYFSHVQRFDYVDTVAFMRAVDNVLPRYKALFKRHAGEQDWRQLAAVAYQESHWDPKAKSPTGVRGMMMLTLPTAKRMKVSNRLDPEQSIRGGSDYLQQLLTRLPRNIPQDEQIWFALAAYNIGLGHLEDARVLTQRQGQDPNSWRDVKKHLPLLRQKKYYQRSKYGYARGDEATHYVENIRRYYDTLVWLDAQQQPDTPPQPAELSPAAATSLAPQ